MTPDSMQLSELLEKAGADDIIGQVLFLLEKWRRDAVGTGAGAVRCWNSVCNSVFSSSICLSSSSLMTNRRQVWLARAKAANISFKTARSPKACGMVLVRRRSSPNSRSRRLVVRIAWRWAMGRRKWAMQASKSSSKLATAPGNSRA